MTTPRRAAALLVVVAALLSGCSDDATTSGSPGPVQPAQSGPSGRAASAGDAAALGRLVAQRSRGGVDCLDLPAGRTVALAAPILAAADGPVTLRGISVPAGGVRVVAARVLTVSVGASALEQPPVVVDDRWPMAGGPFAATTVAGSERPLAGARMKAGQRVLVTMRFRSGLSAAMPLSRVRRVVVDYSVSDGTRASVSVGLGTRFRVSGCS